MAVQTETYRKPRTRKKVKVSSNREVRWWGSFREAFARSLVRNLPGYLILLGSGVVKRRSRAGNGLLQRRPWRASACLRQLARRDAALLQLGTADLSGRAAEPLDQRYARSVAECRRQRVVYPRLKCARAAVGDNR
jgi:lysophospholipase L1-like esterase